MATHVLEAKITGDVSGLKKALTEAERLQADYGKAIKRTQKDIAENITISRQYQKAIDQLNKELADGSISSKDYSKQLERIKRDEKETQVATSDLRKELARLKREQKDLATVNNTATESIGGLKKGTVNATPTLTEFSRVIQDAPYGIQGVANNIQQLTTQFTYLQKNAGGTGAALKSLAGSFLGPAGMIFAVSTITSVLVTYGDELFSTANKVEELEGKIESLNDSFQSELDLNKEQERSLELQGKSVDGILASRQEIIKTQLESLKGLIQQQAELLKLQQIQNQTTTDWEAFVLVLDDALDAIKKFATFSFDQSVSLLKDGLDIVSSLKDTWVADLIPSIKDTGEIVDALNKKLDEKKKLNKASAEDQQKENDLQSRLNQLKTQELKLENDLLELGKKSKGGGGSDIQLRPNLEIASELTAEGGTSITKYLDYKRDEFGNIVKDRFGKKIKEFVDLDLSIPELKIPEVNDDNVEDIIKNLKRIQNEALLFTNVTNAAMSGLTASLTESLQTGNKVFDGIVQAFIKTGEQLLQQMIAQAIAGEAIKTTTTTATIAKDQAVATSGAVAAASQTAASSGPAAAFLLPGLIGAAIGFIAAAFSGIKFAQGGIVPGGSFNGDRVPAMLNSGEMVLNTRQQTRLFDVLDGNFSRLQNNTGSSNLVANTVLRGKDLLLAIEREQRSR